MDDVPAAREIPDSTIKKMIGSIDLAWKSRQIDAAERGFCSVYRVTSSEESTPKRYLKVSPDGQSWGIPVEARLQAVLDTHTSIPVPEVFGVVDDHAALPTPFYLMRALPGEELPEYVSRFEDSVLRRLAREIGEYLGELHSIPAVDSFGHIRHDGPKLAGERPTGNPENLTVGNSYEAWPTYLRERVNHELDRHADSRFSDLTAELDRWFEVGIRELNGPFDPVLGRNDHGLHNLLVDPETLSTPEPRYEALAMVRIMNDFHHLNLPDGTETAVMDRISSDVRALLI